MKILLLLLACFIIFALFIWIKVRKEIYHDPVDGTIYKYDEEIGTEDFYDEFGPMQINMEEAEMKVKLLNELRDNEDKT